MSRRLRINRHALYRVVVVSKGKKKKYNSYNYLLYVRGIDRERERLFVIRTYSCTFKSEINLTFREKESTGVEKQTDIIIYACFPSRIIAS